MTYICAMIRSILLLFMLLPAFGWSQNSLTGRIESQKSPLAGVHLMLQGSNDGCVTRADGSFELISAKKLPWTLRITAVGYLAIDTVLHEWPGRMNIRLRRDALGLQQVVVSANRDQVAQRDAPILVQVADRRLLTSIQAVDVSAGLNFMPGVRTETNCQNCGFTSVRLNGLPGAYTQVLINSRPVYSALAGVYGLEQLPATMIERIEVVRGGGSALYGGNAVAGTINLITRESYDNNLESSVQARVIGEQSPEYIYQLSTTRVNEHQTAGLTIYSQLRKRQEFDANGDGFSELTRLRNFTKGLQAFWKPDKYRKLLVSGHAIDEFRRGGNKFELEPHQTDITEQLRHRIYGGMIQYDQLSKDYRNKWSVYSSAQYTARESYYGGGGRVLASGDSLTQKDILALNAYGHANDLAAVTGLSLQRYLHDRFTLVLGTEVIYNRVLERIPGYNRRIDQSVYTSGTFVQLQYKYRKHTLLAGGRLDLLRTDGAYTLYDTSFGQINQWVVPVPRISWMYQPSDHWRMRFSYAQGYRAPQAFDEDLHLETVGGAARMSTFGPDLLTERSQNLTTSLDFADRWGDRPVNFVLDGFITLLERPFVWSSPLHMPNGISVIQKLNGPGARVQGMNLELRMAEGDRWLVQASLTWQKSRYEKPLVIWSGDRNGTLTSVVTHEMLRSPDLYGYLQGNYRINRHWGTTLMGNFTGGMWAAHVTNPLTEFTEIKFSDPFVDLSFRLTYDFFLSKTARLQAVVGIDNMLNSYQRDFDTGALRDANYVYGPSLPRSVMSALRFTL